MTEQAYGLVPAGTGPKARIIRLNIGSIDVDMQVVVNADPVSGNPQTIASGAGYVTGRMIGLFATGILVNGSPLIIPMLGAPLPALVWVRPAIGDTVLMEYSTDNGVNYASWPNGSVTVYSEDALILGVTHLRVTRTAGTGITSTYGVC